MTPKKGLRSPSREINRDYVHFNCGATVLARRATKWPSIPRAAERGGGCLAGMPNRYFGGGAAPWALGWAPELPGCGFAGAGGFAAPPAASAAFGSGFGLSDSVLR